MENKKIQVKEWTKLDLNQMEKGEIDFCLKDIADYVKVLGREKHHPDYFNEKINRMFSNLDNIKLLVKRGFKE